MNEETRRQLLYHLENRFPLVPDPMAELADAVDLDRAAVVEAVNRLIEDGTVRRVGPVFDPRALGFVSTLVMGEVPEKEVEAASQAAGEIPEITHNYLRDHQKNLWFTVIAPDDERLDSIIAKVARAAPGGRFDSLPAQRVFKIDARFSRKGGGSPYSAPDPVRLSESEKALAGVLETGLSFSVRPFAAAAEASGMTEDEVISVLRGWIDRRVLRRFGAVLRHTRMGFGANGMCVFTVAEEAQKKAGETLASFDRVSHCYLRRSVPGWPFHLYAMAHGREPAEVEEVLRKGLALPGVRAAKVLFTARELKKTAMRYF